MEEISNQLLVSPNCSQLGYARVSTDVQNLDLEIHTPTQAGSESVLQEKPERGIVNASKWRK